MFQSIIWLGVLITKNIFKIPLARGIFVWICGRMGYSRIVYACGCAGGKTRREFGGKLNGTGCGIVFGARYVGENANNEYGITKTE